MLHKLILMREKEKSEDRLEGKWQGKESHAVTEVTRQMKSVAVAQVEREEYVS